MSDKIRNSLKLSASVAREVHDFHNKTGIPKGRILSFLEGRVNDSLQGKVQSLYFEKLNADKENS